MNFPCIVALCIIISLIQLTSGCDPSQTRQGCKIQDQQCICGVGCYSEYRYNSKEQCIKALKAKRMNVCEPNPCYHEGQCTQTSQESRGFKCRCSGTGFYGKRCQFACPSTFESVTNFPYECIIIQSKCIMTSSVFYSCVQRWCII